ncbi:MAG TPA: Pls/PosA family non-ribosomal peptide synthetase, partial [Pseudonocardia sp.]|uniref:Pls/PosA family non-ribosomal peptide synthetase n=1 Tax=Pseudonocardia sp. TaxID=60912 RepID=UPI002D14710F
CPPELAERVAVEGREVWNTYGPTEATVVACAAQLTGEGPVRIGLPLDGWALAVVDSAGDPVAMGESGELVIGGVGLARYLDTAKDAAKFAALPSLGWERAYRSGDVVRADEAGLLFLGRADEQVKLGGRRIELGEVDAALLTLPGVRGAAAAVRRTRAGNQVLVGYVVPEGELDTLDITAASLALREQLPGALVPLLAVIDDLPTRTSGKVDRDALPWPLPAASGVDPVAAGLLTPTEGWLAEGWAEIIGVSVADPGADFFSHGGGSLTAAQLVARIRTRHPRVSVNDIYLNPKLGSLAAQLDTLSATTTSRRDVAPTPRHAAFAQALLMAPILVLVGLRWASVAAAISTTAAFLLPRVLPWAPAPWMPAAPWWSLAVAWLVLFSPAGRVGIAAGGARLLLRGVRPGSYPRGGSVHVRLWAATRLAELSGATGVSSASWTTRYARALGAKIGNDVDLHSTPPVTGMLKLGRGAAVEPEVDLAGHWVDGDVVHIGKIRIGAGATVGSRSTLLPGTRIGKGAEIAAGSTVRGAVPAGQRWAGSPAERTGKSGVRWPSARPPRSRTWTLAYGVTSMLLGLLPAAAALPALVIVATGVAESSVSGTSIGGATTSPSDATGRALLMVAPATLAYLLAYAALVVAGVRLLGIGMAEGFHPVHSRAGWQVWTTERLMGMARTSLFPLYASQFTAAWLRLLGAKVGRDVEASTVIALPKMTTVADGAFLADDTMVGTYELSGGWLHVAPSRVGKQAFLGNSGMTAPGRSVPNRGLVGVLSATPRKAKKGSSWLGLPPMPLRRTVERGDTSRTFNPPRQLKIARGLIELCRVVPVMCSVALAVLVVGLLMAIQAAAGFGVAALLAGPLLLAAGVTAAGVTTAMKWLLVGRFRPVEHPLWSSFVWRNELADTFVEVL